MPFRSLDPSTAAAAPVITSGAPLASVGETLTTLQNELVLEFGSRGDVDLPRITKWINWAYRGLCGMLTLQELKASLVINGVVDQPFYLLPRQVRAIRNVSLRDSTHYYKGGINLTLSNEEEYKRQPDNTATRPYFAPKKYFRYNRMLVVWPDFVSVLTMDVDFWIRPDPLVNPTDSPILPEEFHEPLLLYTRQKGWRSLQEFKKAATAGNDFISVLRPLRNTDGEEQENAPAGLTVARKASDLTRTRR
jgi:hypothetical protein